jgi:bifunctional UDP-N-acetylglucosamine pyrophosphorylase/glucosamine-1-phosphate N-acetyltransferase
MNQCQRLLCLAYIFLNHIICLEEKMSSVQLAAVILAAGQGKRMKSKLPKVLHSLAGKPMIKHVLTLCQDLGAEPIVSVVGHGAELVQKTLEPDQVKFAMQKQQLGTGHALSCAAAQLAKFSGNLLLLCGDTPLLKLSSLRELLKHHQSSQAGITVLTAKMPDPTGYGRIIRCSEGVTKIVEEKDATSGEKAITEINTGIYLFKAPEVFEHLKQLGNNNAQGEYYLTDIIAAARGAGTRVEALILDQAEEAMGINDRIQLAEAETTMRKRINERHQSAGVTLVDPSATYIEMDVTIEADTVIYPNVHLRGQTKIGCNCIIEPGVVVTDCVIGDGVHLKPGSVLSESLVGNDCTIGPMAHLRPGTELSGNNKLGNFVETKKATFGKRSQASHLTYIGDSSVGENVNIGCGTITCNYDGVNKYRTTIEDDVFVGSDTQFIAPVTIGRGSLIAAGSTITKDVPADALAIARTEQKNIEGWAARNRLKKAKKKEQ